MGGPRRVALYRRIRETRRTIPGGGDAARDVLERKRGYQVLMEIGQIESVDGTAMAYGLIMD